MNSLTKISTFYFLNINKTLTTVKNKPIIKPIYEFVSHFANSSTNALKSKSFKIKVGCSILVALCILVASKKLFSRTKNEQSTTSTATATNPSTDLKPSASTKESTGETDTDLSNTDDPAISGESSATPQISKVSENSLESDDQIDTAWFKDEFNALLEKWENLKSTLQNSNNGDLEARDNQLQTIATKLHAECLNLLNQVIDFGCSKQADPQETPNPNPNYFHSAIQILYGKMFTILQNISLFDANDFTQNTEFQIPGGINNQAENIDRPGELSPNPHAGNRCYISSVLQLLNVAYRSRMLSSDLKNPNLKFISEAIEKISKGESIEYEEAISIEQKIKSVGLSSEKVGSQTCALELLGNILSEFEAETFPALSAKISTGMDPSLTDPSRQIDDEVCILNVPIVKDSKTARSLTEALQNLVLDTEGDLQTITKFTRLPDILTINIIKGGTVDFDKELLEKYEKIGVDKLTEEKQVEYVILKDLKDNRVQKINDPILVEDLWVIPSNVVVEERPIVYQLKGFISHHGEEINSGHYTFYFPHGNEWYHADDEKVQRVAQDIYNNKKSTGLVYVFQRVNI